MRHTKRGVSPVMSTILLAAIVVVLAATMSVALFGVGEAVTEPAPTATFDDKQTDNGTVVLRHIAGETIDRRNLAVKGGTIDETATAKTITAGRPVVVKPEREEITLAWETEDNSATLASVSGIQTTASDPAVITQTGADEVIPVRELGDGPSETQFDALTSIELADPFTLAVKAPNLAGQESTDYAVTFFDTFNEAPSDRLSQPPTSLDFDENGIAEVTIGSAGTDADETTAFSFSSLLANDATVINNIEVPNGTEAVAVETE